MNYTSTRNNAVCVSSATAIGRGISEDGGLFLPTEIPSLDAKDFEYLKKANYIDRAAFILKKFLTDFTESEISYCVNGAYTGSFENEQPAPLYSLPDKVSVLELWHGPTSAFKDLALQLLPYLLTTSAKKTDTGKIVILVATSGDTGKAALEGFSDVEGTDIIVFYPSEGVSAMQKLQMDTQTGKNVAVFAIRGNFDDAQSAVKEIFTNSDVKKRLAQDGFVFSSANSINWGRLVPQIVYYVSAYCDLLKKGEDLTDGFNVTVPTGNFGNILAAYYAKRMGVPINKLICASNINNVLTDFINTGVYDKNRPFHTTTSPSMDILISSNLERMLYILTDGDDKAVAKMQSDLKKDGKFALDSKLVAKVKEVFYGGFADDIKVANTIKSVYEKYGYLIDTHTAVGFAVYDEYKKETGDSRPTVIASTASPYKFAPSVLSALDMECDGDGFEKLEALSRATSTAVPAPLKNLRGKEVRFGKVINPEEMTDAVYGYLNM